MRPEPSRSRFAPYVRWVPDAGYAALLTLLFWLVYYSNLPNSLDGFKTKLDASTFGAANTVDRLIKLCMIGTSLWLVARRPALSWQLYKQLNPGHVAFLGLALVSVLWSIAPDQTVLRFISLIAVQLVCFAFGLASWQPARFQQVVLPPLLLLLAGTLAVGAVDSNLVIEVGDDISLKGAWHGLTHGKNELGMMASMGTIICAHALIARSRYAGWAFLGMAISAACLLLSKSNTSLFATLVAILTMLLLLRSRLVIQRHTARLVYGVAGLILLYELIIQHVVPGLDFLLSPIMALTGKDTTFSARTVIWAVIKAHMQGAPLLGTGYGAYWIGPVPTSPSYVFLAIMYLYPTESHNGYLEVMNDLGVAGLLCVLAFIFYFLRNTLRLMHTDRVQAVLYVGLLYQLMVMNLSESDWFSRSNTFSVLALASVALSRGLLEARLRAGARPA